tara:strand:- start:1163 stop:1864 length:702 start_codon:yes stop_codon:yes gene_type:complete
MSARIISFDTETTGLDFETGDRVIELGAVEILERNKTGEEFQTYLNPDGKEISEKAQQITGITNEQLKDKPKFKDIADDFLNFVRGAELVIHNAEFDVGFINNELKLANHKVKDIRDICTVYDTLTTAQTLFPGQRNNLNALSARLGISGYDRTYHGALLDAQILADTYLNLTGGQVTFDLSQNNSAKQDVQINQEDFKEIKFKKFIAGEKDIQEHEKFINKLNKKTYKEISW